VQKKSLKEALFNRRMLICIFTGFTSGLPLYLIYQLIPVWLRTEGVDLKSIGLFALVGFPYTWKFLWSPLMDRYTPRFLGRRRGWMLSTQVLLMFSIALLGFFDPKVSIWLIAYLAAAVAFFSASQDIVIDAYRRELLPDDELGMGNTIHVNAYRISGFVPGALGLILADHVPWQIVFFVMAGFMLIGVGMTLMIQEAADTELPPRTLQDAVVAPFKEFIGRKGWRSAVEILGFMFLYKLGDSMATALSSPFYLDLGFSMTEIGLIAKNAAMWPMIIGGFLGGALMVRIGINRGLWVFGLVQIVTILGFAALSEIGPNKIALAIVISLEYLGVGLGTTAFVAFIARSTHKSYTATQIALFTSLTGLPRTFANATTGFIVEATGWTNFFFICTALAVPGMLLLFRVAPWNGDFLEET